MFNIDYTEAVEEAICFGWIDSIKKKIDDHSQAQRFTPRSKRNHWTEYNKERARRLIRLGKMTESGLERVPDLSEKSFKISEDVMNELKNDQEIYENFKKFPALYIRVRVGYIQEYKVGNPEYLKRLNN
ncbi:MAG: hypothetical protein ABI581_16945, partial [Sediminibacterium sp.]